MSREAVEWEMGGGRKWASVARRPDPAGARKQVAAARPEWWSRAAGAVGRRAVVAAHGGGRQRW
jgi:hypothetical protein